MINISIKEVNDHIADRKIKEVKILGNDMLEIVLEDDSYIRISPEQDTNEMECPSLIVEMEVKRKMQGKLVG